jgi:preprotein translocase subunit SecD
VAQTPPSAGRPGRQLLALGLVFAFLFGLMFFAGTSGMSVTERMTPKLGLDLIGGTRVAMQAVTEEGQTPEEDQLELARQIIESRVNALGVEEAEVVAEGNDLIVVSVAGESEDALRNVGEPAELRFRKVLARTVGGITPPESPEPGATPSPDPGQSPEPDATPEPGTTPEPGATPTPESDLDAPEDVRAQIMDTVGEEAMQAALNLTAPVDPNQDPETAQLLAPFGELTGQQVAALPVRVQFNVPDITCGQLNARPAGSIQDPEQLAVACDTQGSGFKYLLDTSSVLGTAVDDASAQVDTDVNQWIVSLNFNREGQRNWTDLTREAVNNQAATPLEQAQIAEDNTYGGPQPVQCDPFSAVGDQQNCLVAVVLDNRVVSAPQILSVIAGQAEIRGDFTAGEARELATQLRYGALPLTFKQQEAQTVTPTLGTEYLRAGLIAAGIGVLLVLLYSFFYYRLLGIVIFGSLVISSALIFAALVVLGRNIGFTLTLAGISGFIVAVGIAADSFVIYFERLKDEIREGRTPRSAVPRAWVRARRTILTANAVTLLAALVLYLLSAGQVRGFAFALGLATVLDLLTVFTFRHPIMVLLARTPAFLSPTMSGLGRALELDRKSRATGATGTPPVTPQTREA